MSRQWAYSYSIGHITRSITDYGWSIPPHLQPVTEAILAEKDPHRLSELFRAYDRLKKGSY